MRPHRLLLILLSSLLWTAHAEAQTIDLPAMIRCKAEGERASSRSQLIEIWLSRAEKRDAVAAFCLAYVQSDTIHVPLGWLEQSARLNLPDAQLLMGSNYEVGLLFKQDFVEALSWYRKAADQDFPYAQYELASIYYEGRAGQKKNIQEAYFWGLLAQRHQFFDARAIIQTIEPQIPEREKRHTQARIDRWVQHPKSGRAG
jgi:TPR repeat protein